MDKVFEKMLESRLRSEIKEKTERVAEAREMLTAFFSQLSEKTRYRRPRTTEKERKALPMKMFGEVFYSGDGIIAVVGDVEIRSGSIVDRPLVVKGKIKIGANC